MIYHLKIDYFSGPSDEEWSVNAEFIKTTNFMDLHYFMMRILDFDNDHHFSFYYGDKYGRVKDTIFEFENDEDKMYYEEKIEDFAFICLDQVFPLNKKSLYYLFDWGDSWIFRITKVGKDLDYGFGEFYPAIIKEPKTKLVQYASYEEDEYIDEEESNDKD